MKRLVFCGMLLAAATVFFAQQSSKVKLNDHSGEINNSRSASPGNGTHAVSGTFICTNGYIPGGTSNLIFAITTTNSDGEYIDSISITFPSGFTINSTSASPTFPTSDNGGGAELFNGISGQTITWGSHLNNTDNWGGIWAGTTQYFSINVTAVAISGTQTANFFAKGDEYAAIVGNTNGDWSGTISIPEAPPNDLRILNVWTSNGCNLTSTEMVHVQFMNNGSSAQTSFPLSYSVNGGIPVSETYTGTINPGDSANYTFTATADLSAQGIYLLEASVELSSDTDTLNDSTLYESETTVSMFPPYNTGFESSPLTDLLGWTTFDADSGGISWEVVTLTPHTGTSAVREFEGVAGASDDWLFSRCLDFDQANVYRLTWWSRLNSGTIGSLGIFIGVNNSVAGMQNIYPLTNLGNPDIYVKDSIDFTVAASGTYYIGFEALQSDTNGLISLRLDDINVLDLGPANGIKKNSVSEKNIFPNPTMGSVFVQTKQDDTGIEIFDAKGKLVHRCASVVYGENNLELSHLEEGVYFMKISGKSETRVNKIILLK